MPNWIHRPAWWLPDGATTDETVFWNRREVLRALGFTGMGALGVLSGALAGCADSPPTNAVVSPRTAPPPRIPDDVAALFPAQRNTAFEDAGRPLTAEELANRYNNFYEFTTLKEKVWRLADRLDSRPWEIEVAGLVEHPGVFDVDDLIRMFPMEERVYRFRCVEAWAMTVPWTGIPFRELIRRVQPTANATHVRFVTFLRPEQAPGQQMQTQYPWPYYEGLRLDEAMNELTLLATGVYGRPMPNQHGAPIRLITPWKYGYKNIKSIVRIEFTNEQPHTFWNDLQPREYDFLANVNPAVPHLRWSQATERLLGTQERVPTLPFNGYAEQVAEMYT